MSDFAPDGSPSLSEDIKSDTIADSQQGGSSGLTIESLPDYVIALLTTGPFLTGTTVPVKWSITRLDGQLVDAPSTASIEITDDQNQPVATIQAADIKQAVEGQNTPQIIWTLYPFTTAGKFIWKLIPTIGEELPGLQSPIVVI